MTTRAKKFHMFRCNTCHYRFATEHDSPQCCPVCMAGAPKVYERIIKLKEE